jgi:aspartyl-tRNA(Asn)/glutamyl-tRNA(Gln) amidotransferase subunit A
VLLGKTTMPELGWKGVTDCALTGISRNPWNPQKTCGGSSGGAAIAAAAGFGALNLGSDGAGSIRMPAGFCGVFGLKGTFGRVPAYPYGTLPMCSHSGPLTRTVADGALMYTVMTEPDARDWLAVPHDGRDYRVGLEDGVRGLRVAYSRDLGYAKVDREVAALVDKAAKVFADLGAIVEEKDPGFKNPYEPFVAYYAASMAVTLDRMGGAKAAKHMDPGYVRMATQGRRYTAKDLLDAWDARHNLGRHEPVPPALQIVRRSSRSRRSTPASSSRRARHEKLGRLEPVHLSIQLHHAAGGFRALRPDARRPTGRDPGGDGALSRGLGVPRGAGV